MSHQKFAFCLSTKSCGSFEQWNAFLVVDPEKTLANLEGIIMKRKDTFCLREEEWLTNTIAHYFLELLRHEEFA